MIVQRKLFGSSLDALTYTCRFIKSKSPPYVGQPLLKEWGAFSAAIDRHRSC